jgi:thiol-disulfide isomerase/thioredoxin
MMRSRVAITALVASVACSRGSSDVPAPHHADARTPSITNVHVCGGTATDRIAVKAGTRGIDVPTRRDGSDCFRFVADSRSRTILDIRGNDGRALLSIAPIPGSIAAQLRRTPTPTLEITSHDAASLVATAQNAYDRKLRLSHDAASRADAHARLQAAADDHERDAWALIGYVLARTPKAEPTPDEREHAVAFIRDLAPDHWAWSLEWETVVLAGTHGDIPVGAVERIAAEHADPDVRGAAAYTLAEIGRRDADLPRIRSALTALRADEDAAQTLFARVAGTYDPDDGLREGQPLPLLLLANAEREAPLELADLRGRVVVLHFWSTWCGGCREGVAALERLHAEHGGEQLAIVSIAFDEEWAAVTRFRATHGAMPWTHARLRGESVEAITKRFEITGSTKTIVVGRDGRILGENLHPSQAEFATLVARALAPKSP